MTYCEDVGCVRCGYERMTAKLPPEELTDAEYRLFMFDLAQWILSAATLPIGEVRL